MPVFFIHYSYYFSAEMKVLLKAIYIITLLFLFSAPGVLYSGKSDTEIILKGLQSNDVKKQHLSLKYIRENKPESLPAEIARLIINSGNNEKRKIYLKAFKYYDRKKQIPLWMEILNRTKSFTLKIDIIKYTSQLNDRRIVIPLTKELSSPFYLVRKNAAIVLKKSGDDRMYPFILSLAEKNNPLYKLYALEALSYLYDKRFYSTIISLLKDPNKSVRIYSIECLTKNRLTESLYLIRNTALKDRDSEVRIKAIEAITHLKDRNSLHTLLKLLSDYNRDIRYNAVRALNRLNLKSSVLSLSNRLKDETDEEIKYLIINTFIKFKRTGTIEGLKRILLHDNNFRLRVLAAYALGYIKDEKALPILRKAINDKDYRVRAEICNSLGEYRAKAVLPQLLAVLKTEQVRYVKSASLYSIKRFNKSRSILDLFNIYTAEKDPVFKYQMENVLRNMMKDHF